MNPFVLTAIHSPHMLVGGPPRVRAVVRVDVSGLGAGTVEAALQVWTPRGASVAVLGERAPTTRDLREGAVLLDDRTVACAAGRWRDGARLYEVEITLPPGRAGNKVLAARVAVAVDGEVVGRAPVAVTWTADATLVAPPRSAEAPTAAAGSVMADLPTDRSPALRHALGGAEPTAVTCPACDLRSAPGDNYCEGCGEALGDVQKS